MIPSACERFISNNRIKRSDEFRAIRTRGTTIFSKQLLLVIAPALTPVSRLGVTVSKKVHKRAVRRNYIKRSFRESFRRVRSELKSPSDIIVIARKTAITSTACELDRELRRALQRAKLLQ
jgi:ribonuclease P protein component